MSLDLLGLLWIGIHLYGVLGVECSNHSVPTILFNDLAQSVTVGLFHVKNLPPHLPPQNFLSGVSFVLVLS